ncbi:MAG: hypothetical protein ACYCPQ_06320 [Elusimicrobiota bacterium]
MIAQILVLAATLCRPARARQAQDLSAAYAKLSMSVARGAKLSKKTAAIHVYVCAGSGASDAAVSLDISRAAKILGQCGISLDAPSPPYPRAQTADGSCNMTTDEGADTFSSGERALISRYRAEDERAITVFYMGWNSRKANQAGTSIPLDYAQEVKTGEQPAFLRRAVGTLFIFEQARVMEQIGKYTLAHEMTHILTADSHHLHDPADADNLMYVPAQASRGAAPEGSRINAAQCRKMENSPFLSGAPR